MFVILMFVFPTFVVLMFVAQIFVVPTFVVLMFVIPMFVILTFFILMFVVLMFVVPIFVILPFCPPPLRYDRRRSQPRGQSVIILYDDSGTVGSFITKLFSNTVKMSGYTLWYQ